MSRDPFPYQLFETYHFDSLFPAYIFLVALTRTVCARVRTDGPEAADGESGPQSLFPLG